MLLARRSGHVATVILATGSAIACSVQLVAPYNSDLQQKASYMQAEVAAWDLTMRGGAGTIPSAPLAQDNEVIQ